MPLRREDLLKRGSHRVQFGLVTLLEAVFKANNRGIAVVETNLADPEPSVPNEITWIEFLAVQICLTPRPLVADRN